MDCFVHSGAPIWCIGTLATRNGYAKHLYTGGFTSSSCRHTLCMSCRSFMALREPSRLNTSLSHTLGGGFRG